MGNKVVNILPCFLNSLHLVVQSSIGKLFGGCGFSRRAETLNAYIRDKKQAKKGNQNEGEREDHFYGSGQFKTFFFFLGFLFPEGFVFGYGKLVFSDKFF